MDNATLDRIRQDIAQNPVVVYMKGTPAFPQCGFSAAVVEIFSELKVDIKAFDVLVDPALREQLKIFSNWPTFPQVYIKGNLIGGCDIVREMYEAGELQTLLEEQGILPA